MNYAHKVMRRGETRWVIDIRYRTPDGSQKRYRRDAQVQTRSAADNEVRRLLARLAEEGTLEPLVPEAGCQPERTVGNAIDHFMVSELPKKKPSTQRGYKIIVESEIRPRYANRKLSEIDKQVHLDLDTDLKEAGLSASARRNVLVVFRRVIGAAFDAGWLEYLPNVPRLPRVGRTAVKGMRSEDTEAVFAAATPAFRLAGLVARDAGLRASEVRGLRWTDVDLNARTITVRRAICHGKEAPPKSGHQRVIPMTDELFEALSHAEGSKASPWAPVAPSSKGTIWSESGLRNAFQAASRRAAVTGFRFHDLRHFFVTQLFRHGASAPVAQRLAGHEVLTTTQRYAHADDDECRAAVVAVSKARRGE